MPPTAARFAALLPRYDGFLFDAYGVLVDQAGARPGAAAAVAAVRAAGRPLAVVTNDTSRLPATAAARFAGVGIDVAADEIVTPGLLLPGLVAARGLAGATAVVLGNRDACAYAVAAGLTVIDGDRLVRDGLATPATIDALVVCDDGGFDFLPGMNAALTACVRALDAGRPLTLVTTNPDLIYPRGGGALGFTAGSMALMLETALARRYPAPPRFVALGKPAPALFALGQARLGGAARVVMIGDSLETDIAGARAAGLDAALVAGVSVWHDGAVPDDRAPHWLLPDLGPALRF